MTTPTLPSTTGVSVTKGGTATAQSPTTTSTQELSQTNGGTATGTNTGVDENNTSASSIGSSTPSYTENAGGGPPPSTTSSSTLLLVSSPILLPIPSSTLIPTSSSTPLSISLSTPLTTSSMSADLNSSSTEHGAGSTSSSDPAHITPGQLIGGIIGAAAIAALIAVVATYCVIRRRGTRTAALNRRQRRSHDARGDVKYVGSVASRNREEKSPQKHDSNVWEQYLAQAVDDRTIQGLAKTLFDQVQVHVENFYGPADVKITQDIATNLMTMQTPHLPDPLASIMVSSNLPLPAIKHCLAYLVAESVSLNAKTVISLLPTAYAAVVRDCGTPNHKSSNPVANKQAYGKLKALTAYFRPDSFTSPDEVAGRDRIIDHAVETFSDAFYLWELHPQEALRAREHLVELLKTAAHLATVLFPQTSTFDFRWQQSGSQESRSKRSLVVTPAFVKIADEHGYELEQPQMLMQRVVERV